MNRVLWVIAIFCALWIRPALAEPKDSPTPYLTLKDVSLHSAYPVKRNIVTTYFWIGQGSTSYSDTTNYASAWDRAWTRNYGGVDHPEKRVASAQLTTLPKKFAPTLNPFYVALPFNDIKYPELAAKYVPWYSKQTYKDNPLQSQCQGRWIMIEFKGRVCFAQWEDVGPLRYDHVKYVFGTDRPSDFNKAGLDVSPAVRDYLGLSGLDKTNWRFVDNDEVPYGPWIEYAEQAILFSAIKNEARQRAN
jgi:hypothetical protein